MPSYYAPRRRRRFRRSPLSDILMALIAIVLIVLLVVLIRSLLNSTDAPNHGSHPLTTPSLPASPLPSQPDTSPDTQPAKSDDIPWYLTLVNADHPLSEDFTLDTATLPNGKAFDARAYDALTNMLNDCRSAGLEPLVCSAYRTVESQTELFNNKISKYMASGMSYDEAYAATATEIAIPGTSEHSLGLAADICALSYQLLDDAQADTAEQQWLMAHCAEYGFILRYPKDKEDITGIIYEPWHYRYVGVEAAQEIMESGLCLEEYMQLHYQLD